MESGYPLITHETAEKARSSGAQAPNFEPNPAKAGFFSRIYPALIIVGGFIPRRTAFFSDLAYMEYG
jgi:hypothetical protein